MPHAEASFLPPTTSKAEFYANLTASLQSLLEDQTNWVINLSNASSVIYHAMDGWDEGRGMGVNWAGFYLVPHLFPRAPLSQTVLKAHTSAPPQLLLGPFHGRPACQLIRLPALPPTPSPPTFPIPRAGVCATAFLMSKTLVVDDVERFPAHIACDGETKSEIVVPLVWKGKAVGVLDLDCTRLEGFDEQDRAGLEEVARVVVDACQWW